MNPKITKQFNSGNAFSFVRDNTKVNQKIMFKRKYNNLSMNLDLN